MARFISASTHSFTLACGEVPEGYYTTPLSVSEVKRPGRDLTIVTWGAMVERAEEAAKQVAAAGTHSVEVIDLRTLMPWDRETVLASVAKTGRLLAVHFGNDWDTYLEQVDP